MKKVRILLILLQLGFGSYAQTASRLVGFAMYGADTTMPSVDSGGYKYSRERGGTIAARTHYPYNLEGFPFQFTNSRDFETGYFGSTMYDSAWRVVASDSDFSVQFFDEKDHLLQAIGYKKENGNWLKYHSNSYVYDGQNNLINEFDTSWTDYTGHVTPSPSSIYWHQYSYDSHGKVYSQIVKQSRESKWQNFSCRNIIYYNSEIIQIIDTSWAGGAFYSSIVTKIGYKNSLPDSFVQNFQLASGGGGNPTWTYYFSPARDTIIVTKKGDYKIIHVYDGKHNKISTTTILDHPIINMSSNHIEWSYNTFGQVTCQRNYSLDSSGNWVFKMLARFYYETYIPGPPYVKNDLEIYPSPTKSELTLKLLWQDAQPFAVCIYNSVGQRIMQWDEPAIEKYKKTISLPGLASGNYFIQVNSSKQRIVKKFVID